MSLAVRVPRALLPIAGGFALVIGLVGCGSTSTPEDSPETVSRSPRSDGSSLGGSSSSRRQPIALPPVPPGEATLRVLSFNINFAVGHDPRNIAAVAGADADLVLLQETTELAEEAFVAALGEQYPHVLFRECCRAGGLGVMSKYPIVEQLYLEPTVGWFPAWYVVVETPVGKVQALNVHLRPPMSDGGSWVEGYFSTRGIRREEIEDLWPAIDPDDPMIIAGDFNENAEGLVVEFLAGHGLASALPQVEPKAKTWHWQTKVGKIRAMLDHVVYGGGLRLHDAEVLDEGYSDHFPVVAVLGAAPPQ
ncbi:MAG: endonuclease/exonuclease/phosphatase family protein [Myxococcota bacterium]